jgi:hypothetical protein
MNLIPRVEETKQGKEIGALFLSPGLELFTTVGNGPIWGEHIFYQSVTGPALIHFFLYVASGNDIYAIDNDGSSTFLGSVTGVTGEVNFKDNGGQLGIFTTTGAWLIGHDGMGVPLTGGTIGVAGIDYTDGDIIYLSPTTGNAAATAAVEVTSVDGSGGVTGFSISILNGLPLSGLFNLTPSIPTGFVQAFTTGSGSGFELSAPTFGAPTWLYQIPLPFDPVAGQISAVQQDGFIIISQPLFYIMWQSELLDMSLFLPLKFASASGNPTAITSMQQIHREIFVIETYNTEVWINAGTSPFTFARLDGVYIEKGTLSPASVVQIGEELMWLSQDTDGICSIVRLRGYEPRIVSDTAVTTIWQTYSDVTNAIAYAYQLGGRRYYIISFPSGNSTWGYNITDSDLLGVPVWFQLGQFDSGRFNRHIAQISTGSGTQGGLLSGKTILGDYRNGNLYTYKPNGLTDNGAQRKWLRSWRARQPGQASFDPIRFNALQIDMQTGIDVPIDTDPQVELRWSDDGGHSWSMEHFIPAGKLGETARRVKINRLGSTKRNAGLDRIFELSSSDMFPVTIIGADLI